MISEEIISLPDWITKQLSEKNEAVAENFKNNFKLDLSKVKDIGDALRQVNLHWNVELSFKQSKEVFDARLFLTDDVKLSVWKKRFVNNIVPIITSE